MVNRRSISLALLLPGALLSGVSLAGATRANDQSMGASDDKKCQVTVDRRAEFDGTYDVTRQVLENGDCICYVYTGQMRQSDTIEKAIASLQESGLCPDAKVALVPAGAATGFAPALGLAPLAGVGAAGAAGIIAASSDNVSGDDTPGG